MGGGPSVSSPPPRDLNAEARNTFDTQLDLVPQELDAYNKYGPQYSDLQNNLTQRSLFGAGAPYVEGGLIGTYGAAGKYMQDIQGNLNTQQRQQDITDVQNLGGQAVAAFKNANPELAAIQSAQTQRALNSKDPISMLGSPDQIQAQSVTVGPNYGARALLGNTLGELAKGGSLSNSETLGIENNVVNRFNQQGRAGDPSAIAGTALGLDSAQQARLAQRQGAVAGATGLYQNDINSQLQAAMANQGANLSAQQSNQQYNFGTGVANQTAQLSNANYLTNLLNSTSNSLQQTQIDPFQAVLGRSGALQGAAAAAGTAGANANYNGNGAFDPFNPYSQDVYNTNYNAQAAAANASANGQASQNSAMIGGGAAIGGALIIAL